MLMRTCDVQFIVPDETPPPPAPTVDDPAVHAKLATAARSQRGRRFAFCELADNHVRIAFQGIQANNGACFLFNIDQPVGWYTSVDAAFAHRGHDGMVLVWTEPENAPNHSSANLEAAANDASVWLVLLPFRAHGPHDARIRAIEIATAFEDTVPGLTREMALMCDAQGGGTPVTLFCPTPGCLREPYHHGQHQPDNASAASEADGAAGETPSLPPTDHDGLPNSDNEGDGAASGTPRRQLTGHDSLPHSNNPSSGGPADRDVRDGEADA